MRRHPALLPAVALHAAVLFAWSVLRHRHFGSFGYDLGIYVQTLWSLGNHGVPWNSIVGVNEWSSHLEVGLAPLALVYRFTTSPLPLLAVQAAACAAAALPLEAMARRLTGDRLLALAAAGAFLLAPQLVLAEVFDFHSITVCALATSLLVLGAEADRPGALLAGAALALALREQMGLAVAGASVAWGLLHRPRRNASIALAAVSLLWFALQLLVLFPLLGAREAFHYGGRYATLGGSPGAALRFALAHPLRFLVFPVSLGRETYLLQLASGALPLLGVAALALRTAWPLLVAAPLLAIQLYSDYRPHWQIHYQYGAAVVPLLAAAAILALARLAARSPRAARLAALGWLGATAVHLFIVAAPLLRWPGGPLDPAFEGSPRAEALAAALALVPRDASVSAQNDVAAHLAGRPLLHVWPDGEDGDRYVLLDVEGAARGVYKQNTHLVAPAGAAAERLRADGRFAVLIDRAGVLLVRRR